MLKLNTLVFKLNRREGIYVLKDVISHHTMWQDYSIKSVPENEYPEHGVQEYTTGMNYDYYNLYQFVVCKDFKGMDWYINEIAIPYEADISKWKEIMLKVLEADEDVSKNDLKELFSKKLQYCYKKG